MELQPPKKKKTMCLKRTQVVSDTVVLLSCSHFFRVTSYNQPICLPVALKHQSRNAPVLPPLESLCSSLPNSHQNPILFVHYQGAIRTTWVRKKWQIVKRLLIGSLLGRCHLPIFCNSRRFRMMLWNDPISTFDKKMASPSTKKISCKHKSQAKKKFGSGCSGLDAEI